MHPPVSAPPGRDVDLERAIPLVPVPPVPPPQADPPDDPQPAAREEPPVPDVETAPRAVAAGFDEFYRSARPSIARAVALALGDADLAADATDEAMTRAYERWGTIARYEHPEAWIYRVAMNWALSVLRRRRRHRQELYRPEAVEDPAVTDPEVHAALAALDVKQRSVIVCRHLLGWSVADTAAALGVREGTVKSRLHRANQILQPRLQHLHSPEEPR